MDPQAIFIDFIERKRPALVSWVMRRRLSRQCAEDIVQNALLRAWRYLPSPEKLAEFKRIDAWVYLITVREIANYRRRTRETVSLTDNMDGDLVYENPLLPLILEQLHAEIDRVCTPNIAQVMHAATVDSSEPYLAETCGITAHAVKSRLFHGRQRMRDRAAPTREALR